MKSVYLSIAVIVISIINIVATNRGVGGRFLDQLIIGIASAQLINLLWYYGLITK